MKGHSVADVRQQAFRLWQRRVPALLLAFLCALLLLRLGPNLRRRWATANSWDPLASSGPAASPAEWLLGKPTVVLIAFPEWRGIFSAASAQGPVLGIHDMHASSRRAALVDLLSQAPTLRAMVVHGIPPGSLALAKDVRARLPRVRILFVYHGTPSAPFHSGEADLVDQLVQANVEGYVDAVGSVKVGLSVMLSGIGATGVFTVPNFPYVLPLLPTKKYSGKDGKVHIGILVSSDGFHKNVVSQLLAACSVPNAVIHVTKVPEFSYLKRCAAPIVATGLLPHAQFLEELVRMDLVMYVSLTECYPMLVIEAMSVGIPAVVSRTHHIFDADEVLRESLVVDEADNPEAILSRLLVAVARKDELRTRLLALLPCLQRAAELAWGGVLALSEAESRKLQLVEYADRLASGDTALSPISCGASVMRPSLPILFSSLATNTVPLGARIAFITYELSPGDRGDAGLVISHAILELLEAGVGVTVLAHTSSETLATWSQHMAAKGFPPGATAMSTLIVHHVPSLTQEAHLMAQGCHPGNFFLLRARVFALAARLAYEVAPFDAIEVFEYGGAAFELLRSLREWQDGDAREGAPPAPRYLPASVPILVRLHGSNQLVAQAEVGVAAAPAAHARCALLAPSVEAAPLMHLMERYVLQAAHVLLPPSSSTQSLYELAYGLSSERMFISPPPMDSILADLRLLVTSYSLLEPSSAPLGGEGGDFKLLVYGREGKMAGAATVARAAPLLQSLLPASTKLHLVFMGTDWRHTAKRASFGEAVRELLPTDFSGAVEFLGPVELDGALQELCRTVHGAVVASEFETTGLFAHKLATLGVPLVISDIPAFSEFFTAGSAYTFQAGNATDLSTAAARLFEDLLEGHRNALRLAHVKYANSINPYMRLLELAREGTLTSLADVRMTEVAISRLEPGCWLSNGCFEQWARPEVRLAGRGEGSGG